MQSPRIRTLKPELWRDQDLQSQSLGARLTFIGLFSLADDEGRIEGNPALLRSAIHPMDEKVTAKVFAIWLASLDAVGLIRIYTVATKPYIWIPKFRKHQRIDRPRASDLPPYEERDIVEPSSNGHRDLDDESPNGHRDLDDESPNDQRGVDE